jgi:hypothetical protein
MENIAVSLIVKGEFKNVVIPKSLVGDLAVILREEGKCPVHFADKTVMAEGMVILAKGEKLQVMVFPNTD